MLYVPYALCHDLCALCFVPCADSNANPSSRCFVVTSEFGRQTNTGKILNICCPHSTMYVSGIQEEEATMIARLRANPETSFVLFPSTDSISLEQFLSRFDKRPKVVETQDKGGKGKETETSGEAAGLEEGTTKALSLLSVSDIPPLNIVIIDGTWNQAKHLVYNIPADIPRVHINPTSPSLFLLRKVGSFMSCQSWKNGHQCSLSSSGIAITSGQNLHPGSLHGAIA